MNFRYLVVKPPAMVGYYYDCGGKDPCECITMPSPGNHEMPMYVINYLPGFMDSDEKYEQMKAAGLIIHETEDFDTAVVCLESEMERKGIQLGKALQA